MTHRRRRMESGLRRLSGALVRHRVLAVLAVVAFTGVLLARLPTLRIDTSTEGFFYADDPAKLAYDRFRDRFGREETILVVVQPPEVFDRAFLTRLTAFHRALEGEVPFLDEVISLVNVRSVRGRGDELAVEQLLERLPETPAGMAALRDRVRASPLYTNYLISADGRYTALLVNPLTYAPPPQGVELAAGFAAEPGVSAGAGARGEYLSNVQNAAVVRAVRSVAARFEGGDFRIFIAGAPVWGVFLIEALPRDMGWFLGLATLAIGAFLYALFRRLAAVVLPLLVVGLSLGATVGLMAWSHTGFTIPTAILPSFLLAVGVGDSVHLLAIFFREFDRSGDKGAALAEAMGHSGLPILMTTLTTAAGLFAFVAAKLVPVMNLGLFGGIGVLMALVYTLVLMPPLLALWPLRPGAPAAHSAPGRTAERLLRTIADFATGRAWPIVLCSAAAMALAVLGLPHLRFTHDPVQWIPRSSELRRSIDLIDREFKGSNTVEVVIDTGRENGLYDPAIVTAIDTLAAAAAREPDSSGQPLVGKASSLADVLKETHKALNGEDPAAYVVPQSRNLIAQELLLFENSGSDDLERLVDSRFSQARLSLKVRNEDASVLVRFVGDLRREAARIFGPGVRVTVTGIIVLFNEIVHLLMRSMVESYAIAFVVITAMMILLQGSLWVGLLSMVPNLAPILITLGVMGWCDIPLDGFTLLIGSIALGLAVDDTIHFFHNFRRYYGETESVQEAGRRTLGSTGRAMVITTLVLVTGFWLFMFASLNNLFYFGLLTGMTLLIALLADLLLGLAVLELVVRTGRGRRICRRWCGLRPAAGPSQVQERPKAGDRTPAAP